jgi:hypothetical protein
MLIIPKNALYYDCIYVIMLVFCYYIYCIVYILPDYLFIWSFWDILVLV